MGCEFRDRDPAQRRGQCLALDGHRRITQYAQTHFAAHDGMPHSWPMRSRRPAMAICGRRARRSVAIRWRVVHEYDHRENDEIPINLFTALVVDRRGTLWAGPAAAVCCTLSAASFAPSRGNRAGRSSRSVCWRSTRTAICGRTRDRGVVRLHDGVFAAALTTRDGLPSDDVARCSPAATARCGSHVPRAGALGDGRLTRAPAPLDSVAVHSVAEDDGGALWCATDKGLLRLRNGASRPSARIACPTRSSRYCSTATATCGSARAWSRADDRRR